MATTFSNKRSMATAMDSANGITISGDFQINSSNRVINFNGQVSAEGLSGYFNFVEKADGNISFNIDNVPSAQRVNLETLIFAMVADIHAEFNKTEEE